MKQDLTDNDLNRHTDVLDHSMELVAVVYESAPGEYHRLVNTPRVRRAIAGTNRFNYGKVFAFAEYVVFRQEFRARFPEAKKEACINAFCRLFLKNDISMTNLIKFMESDSNEELLLLKSD